MLASAIAAAVAPSANDLRAGLLNTVEFMGLPLFDLSPRFFAGLSTQKRQDFDRVPRGVYIDVLFDAAEPAMNATR